jgi:hypothetical protein
MEVKKELLRKYLLNQPLIASQSYSHHQKQLWQSPLLEIKSIYNNFLPPLLGQTTTVGHSSDIYPKSFHRKLKIVVADAGVNFRT